MKTWRIELDKDSKSIPGLGYKEIIIVSQHQDLEIQKVSIETKLGFPRWIWKDDFYIQRGYNLLEIKAWGDLRTVFDIRLDFYDDHHGENTLFIRSEMVTGSPGQLYDLAKKLIADHKRVNPGMLQ